MKLNYFRFKLLNWSQVAMLLLIFDDYLFKVSCSARPEKGMKSDIEYPEEPDVLFGLVDLDLEDIEVFLPPPFWDQIKGSITQIDQPPSR